MQKVEKRLLGILQRAKAAGLEAEVISNEILNQKELWKCKQKTSKFKSFTAFATLLMVLFLLKNYIYQSGNECLIEMPFESSKIFREPEDCSFCRGVNEVDKVMDITSEDFNEIYASTGRPVVVTDGTRDWSAKELFTFEFFQHLYKDSKGTKNECQFFPYKTEFRSLREALNMNASRARLETGTKHWYIGWSNCNDEAGRVLRQHYKRPYFLPKTSENMALSWIFMGGPGDGAHMHIDNVHYASWQAQLNGRKLWRLAPPPECYYSCQEFQVIVEPGEIVVVDTNRWYHRTEILHGDISITIGTEFD